jgi:hypothetical protein
VRLECRRQHSGEEQAQHRGQGCRGPSSTSGEGSASGGLCQGRDLTQPDSKEPILELRSKKRSGGHAGVAQVDGG